ncbi:MAG: twin-arginine translocase TatA/TatE family subunit [Acidimicrobiia bacterium]
MFGLRGQELLIVLLIVVIIFGARKLPDLARSLGASAKEFRKGIEEGTQGEDPDAQMSDTSDDDPDTRTSDSSEVPDS